MTRDRSAPAIGYGDVFSSLLLIFPLLLIYQIGLVYTPACNGVDFLSRGIFRAVDGQVAHYLYVQLALGATFLLVLTWLWRRESLSLDEVTPLLLESSIYALTLGSFIIFIMDGLVGLDILAVGFPRLSMQDSNFGNALVVSLGAGVHEELVFRLGMMGLGGVLLVRLGLEPRLSVLLAAVVSALAFALAHHMGSAGEPFAMSIFVYRTIAGLAFSAIFYYRSLAHAVYGHFLYDLYVMALAG